QRQSSDRGGQCWKQLSELLPMRCWSVSDAGSWRSELRLSLAPPSAIKRRLTCDGRRADDWARPTMSQWREARRIRTYASQQGFATNEVGFRGSVGTAAMLSGSCPLWAKSGRCDTDS